MVDKQKLMAHYRRQHDLCRAKTDEQGEKGRIYWLGKAEEYCLLINKLEHGDFDHICSNCNYVGE